MRTPAQKLARQKYALSEKGKAKTASDHRKYMDRLQSSPGTVKWSRYKLRVSRLNARRAGMIRPEGEPEDVLRLWFRSTGACQICKNADKVLALDHCHSTGKLRGFICSECNLGLGKFKDSLHILAAAQAYLRETSNG